MEELLRQEVLKAQAGIAIDQIQKKEGEKMDPAKFLKIPLDDNVAAQRRLADIQRHYPLEYRFVAATRAGHPPQALRTLHHYKSVANVKRMLGELLLQLPDALDLTFDENVFDALLSLDATMFAEVQEENLRQEVHINPFNAHRILLESVAWELAGFNYDEIVSGQLRISTKAGQMVLDTLDAHDIYDSVVKLAAEEAGNKNVKYVADGWSESMRAAVYFTLANLSLSVEGQRYAYDNRYYQGAKGVPVTWIKAMTDAMTKLHGRLPTDYVGGKNSYVSAAMYTDLTKMGINFDVPFKDYQEYVSRERKKFEKDNDWMKTEAQRFMALSLPGQPFDRIATEEKALGARRRLGMYRERELFFGMKSMGFDYSPIGRTSYESFFILYAATAAVAKIAGIPTSDALKGKYSLQVNGTAIASRAATLEGVFKATSKKLYVPEEAPAKVTGYAVRFKPDEWTELKSDGSDFLIKYWEGYEGYKVVDNIPNPRQGTEHDKAVLQVILDFARSEASKRRCALLVKHDLQHPEKLMDELGFLMETLTKSNINVKFHMIPYLNPEGKGYCWLVHRSEVAPHLSGHTILSDYALRVIEAHTMLKAFNEAMTIGAPIFRTPCVIDKNLARQAMALVQWRQHIKRQGGKNVQSTTSIAKFQRLTQLISHANPVPMEDTGMGNKEEESEGNPTSPPISLASPSHGESPEIVHQSKKPRAKESLDKLHAAVVHVTKENWFKGVGGDTIYNALATSAEASEAFVAAVATGKIDAAASVLYYAGVIKS